MNFKPIVSTVVRLFTRLSELSAVKRLSKCPFAWAPFFCTVVSSVSGLAESPAEIY